MPELPEVETIAEDLRKADIEGEEIVNVRIFWERSIHSPSPEIFKKKLAGKKILKVSRRGKFLVFSLSEKGILLLHLRMTGRLTLKDKKEKQVLHEHVILTLSNGRELRFHDTRKFGRWYLLDDAAEVLGKLGPEPLENTLSDREFTQRLLQSSRQLKPLLLDQTFLAGLGNIYVDEALWEAKLHPQTVSDTLTDKQAQALFHAIKVVLQRGLNTLGTSLGKGKTNFYRLDGKAQGTHQQVLQVFRQKGKPCPRCGESIIVIKVAQRSTHLCPRCQIISKRRPS